MPYGQPFYTYPPAGYTPYQTPTYGAYTPQVPPVPQNQPLNGFQGQGQVNTQLQTQQPVLPTKTNVPLVTSLTEAMSKTTELNSDTFYADQDKPFIYRVSVDMQGRKTYRTFELTDVTEQEIGQQSPTNAHSIDLSAYATKDDLKAFKDEIMGYAMSLGVVPNMSTTPKTKKVDKIDKTDKPTVKIENEEVKE